MEVSGKHASADSPKLKEEITGEKNIRGQNEGEEKKDSIHDRLKETDHTKNLSIDGRMTLGCKCISKRKERKTETGFFWRRIQSNDGLS